MRDEPFGQADCESEVRVLKSEYSHMYFDETPFNVAAIQPETYLIIGRRGSGKTALSQSFAFQRAFGDPYYIDIDEPVVYQEILSRVARHASESREIAIPRLTKIWEYAVWRIIFEHTADQSPAIATAAQIASPRGSVSHFIRDLFEWLLRLFTEGGDGSGTDEHIAKLASSDAFSEARASAVRLAKARPIILAVDTLERYEVANDNLMNAMAALVQCAAEFNRDYADSGIHLKVFMSGEVFPYMKEVVLQNPLKSVKSPVYLLWRPRDLLRLISWRLHRYLEQHDLLLEKSQKSIDWHNHSSVIERMWWPYFGRELTNGRGLREHTFAYVLRHTQLRPRQLILLCNAIARRSMEAKRFPHFSEEDIREAVREAESDLAVEIINSFSAVYPHVSSIVDVLMNIPMVFKGNELDRRAPQTKNEWPDNTYSQAAFRRLVAELGIVGRVSRSNEKDGFIDADFEYSLRERLPLTHRDQCVIHPMFYRRLNVDLNLPARVMPFSADRDVENILDL